MDKVNFAAVKPPPFIALSSASSDSALDTLRSGAALSPSSPCSHGSHLYRHDVVFVASKQPMSLTCRTSPRGRVSWEKMVAQVDL